MIRGDSGQRDNMGEKISPGVRGGGIMQTPFSDTLRASVKFYLKSST